MTDFRRFVSIVDQDHVERCFNVVLTFVAERLATCQRYRHGNIFIYFA